jgi:hypothetical protein
MWLSHFLKNKFQVHAKCTKKNVNYVGKVRDCIFVKQIFLR